MAQIRNPEKILIIRLSSIGDILLATPLIRILRQRFPDAQLDFLTKSRFSELLAANPYLNHLLPFNDPSGFQELRRVKQHIRTEKYDWIVDIHRNIRTRYLKCGSGSAQHFIYNKRVWRRFLLVHFKLNYYSSIIPVFQRYLEPLSQFGIQDDLAGLDFHFLPGIAVNTPQRFIQFLKLYPCVIGLVPGAGFATKRWPAENFARAADLLAKHLQAGIIIFGGKAERTLQQEIQSRTTAPILGLAGECSLQETAAMMRVCHLIISNDSGLMHLAVALRKKLIAIFGGTTAELGFFPVGDQQIILEAPVRCRPCSHIGKPACPKRHFDCMRLITPEQVQAAALQLLQP